MLFKSNKFFDLKSKKTSVKLVKSINLCQFLNFLLHITGKSCHILRFTYIRVSHSGGGRVGALPPPILRFFFENLPYQILRNSHVWNTLGNSVYVKLRYITAQKVSFLEFHTPRFCDRHIFSLFLTKHVELAQFLLFCNGTFTILMLNFSI